MKKNVLIVAALGLCSISAHGQKLRSSQVPATVKDAFYKKYPGISGTWEQEHDNYEVNFKNDHKSMSATISRDGNILETETDIPVRDLKEAIRHYIKEHYPGATISEAARIVKAGGDVNYEAEVHHKDLVFDNDGNFIKETSD